MSKAKEKLRRIATAVAVVCVVVFVQVSVTAQKDDVEQMKRTAAALMKEVKYVEALPLLEKIVAAEPDDSESHFYLGFALLAKANVTTDPGARRELRVRARKEFVRSRELGNREPLVEALISSMPPDGFEVTSFSSNPAAAALMNTAEAHFSKGEMDDALNDYQKALVIDPKLYHAALFSGDVYMEKGDYQQAEKWYQTAIAIDPDKETAYRYSATPLMKQRKFDEARDRYVEAYVAEPYNRFAISGISQWAQATNTTLAHPEINFPVTVMVDDKGDSKINLDPSVLTQDDGSSAWVVYGSTRVLWRKEKFAKAFPKEASYRHSLAEEAEAVRAVLTAATGDKRTKNLSSALAKLKKLNDEGLLEAYLLLAHADEGLAQDYAVYRASNRATLRRYVIQYVLTGGGS